MVEDFRSGGIVYSDLVKWIDWSCWPTAGTKAPKPKQLVGGIDPSELVEARATLHVDSDATPKQVRRAHRKLALKWHPDRNNGDLEAAAKFIKVQEAYEKLTKYFEALEKLGIVPDSSGRKLTPGDHPKIVFGDWHHKINVKLTEHTLGEEDPDEAPVIWDSDYDLHGTEVLESDEMDMGRLSSTPFRKTCPPKDDPLHWYELVVVKQEEGGGAVENPEIEDFYGSQYIKMRWPQVPAEGHGVGTSELQTQ